VLPKSSKDAKPTQASIAPVKPEEVKFADLFEGLGTEELAYNIKRCELLSGGEVEIVGYLSPSHDGSGDVMLVSRPGDCPDCTPVPVAAILLPGFTAKEAADPVKLRGKLSYGLRMDQDKASFLRLEEARLSTGIPL
jgi:hypothetical protein